MLNEPKRDGEGFRKSDVPLFPALKMVKISFFQKNLKSLKNSKKFLKNNVIFFKLTTNQAHVSRKIELYLKQFLFQCPGKEKLSKNEKNWIYSWFIFLL